MTQKNVPAGAIDLDAMLAKREEEVGSVDRFPFVFKGETYWALDPVLAPDDWKRELRDIAEDEDAEPADVAEHYLGSDQWDKFVAAGGNSGIWSQALTLYLEQQQSVDESGNPTQARRSFNRSQRRSKRR